MIALILCWRSIHLAVINFQLLISAVSFNICKGLSVVHAVCGRLIKYLHFMSVLSWTNIHFKLIWFGGFKTPTWWVFVWWWDDETDFGKIEEACRKRTLSKTSGKGNFIWFELQNKQSPLSVHKLQWLPNP